MYDTSKLDLRKLNSLTKYPSIPTFHSLGERGVLLDECVDFGDKELVYTEKVDGTNSRMVFMPDGRYLIGSREEWLTASGDLIANPAQGIVEATKLHAERMNRKLEHKEEHALVIYAETYGGKATAASKQYTGSRALGVRMFDICLVDLNLLDNPLEKISVWREAGGQEFITEDELMASSQLIDLDLTPRVETNNPPPTDLQECFEWLKASIPETRVALDEGARGEPEGLVVRTKDRSKIAKIRYEDYSRHFRKLRKK